MVRHYEVDRRQWAREPAPMHWRPACRGAWFKVGDNRHHGTTYLTLVTCPACARVYGREVQSEGQD